MRWGGADRAVLSRTAVCMEVMHTFPGNNKALMMLNQLLLRSRCGRQKLKWSEIR